MGFALGLIAATVACACVLAADSAQARPIYIDAPNPGGRERAVVPVPPPGNRLFGIHDNFIISHGPGEWTPEQVAEIAAGAGAEIFRFTIDWHFVEPQRDEWDPAEWQRVENAYDALVAAGIKPLITIATAPPWAREEGLPQDCVPIPGSDIRGCEYPPRPGMLDEWAEFAAEVASRFPESVAIEIWNEPNLTSFYKPRPQPRFYARLVKTAYNAIKAENPGILVLAGALAPTQQTVRGPDGKVIRFAADQFLGRAYRAKPSLRGHLDALSFHHSSQENRYRAGSLLGAVMRDVRRMRNRYDTRKRPLWISEFGLSTSAGRRVTPKVQARSLVRAYRKTMTMRDVRAFVVHTLRDRIELPPSDKAFGFGLIADWDPLTPKPAYCAFAGRFRPSDPYGGCAPVRERIKIAKCVKRVLQLARKARNAKGAARKRLERTAERVERHCLPCQRRIAVARALMRGASKAERRKLKQRIARLRRECGPCLERAETIRGKFARGLVTEKLDYRIRYERLRRSCKP